MPRKYKKYGKLNYEKRKIIEKMLKEGKRIPEIAEAVGVHRETVYREITHKGMTRETYNAETAQMKV